MLVVDLDIFSVVFWDVFPPATIEPASMLKVFVEYPTQGSSVIRNVILLCVSF